MKTTPSSDTSSALRARAKTLKCSSRDGYRRGFDARVVGAGLQQRLLQYQFATGYFMRLHASRKDGRELEFLRPSSATSLGSWLEERGQRVFLDPKSSEFVTTPFRPPEKSKEKRTASWSQRRRNVGAVRWNITGGRADKKSTTKIRRPNASRFEEISGAVSSAVEPNHFENATEPISRSVSFHFALPATRSAC